MNQNKKIDLAGGGYCLYAPRFPRFVDAPGFADEVLIANASLPQLYVLAFLEHGRPLPMQLRSVQKEQGRAVLSYDEPSGLKVVERRFVTQDDRFVSQLELHNSSKTDREFTVVMWSTTDPEGEPVSLEGDSYRIKRNLKSGEYPEVPVEIHFSTPDSKGGRCLQGFFCEGGSDRPDYEETPWYECEALPTPRAKRLMEKPSPIVPGSRVYCGLFRPVPLKAGAKAAHRFEANVIFKIGRAHV